jgi:hypothetical protein
MSIVAAEEAARIVAEKVATLTAERVAEVTAERVAKALCGKTAELLGNKMEDDINRVENGVAFLQWVGLGTMLYWGYRSMEHLFFGHYNPRYGGRFPAL